MSTTIPSIASTRAVADLVAARDKLFARAFDHGRIAGFEQDHAVLFDSYFADALQEAAPELLHSKDFCLVAQGGYGRAEMCRHSDIDVCLLFSRKIPGDVKEAIRAVFYPLWDMKLKLDYSVRTISETLSLAEQEAKVFSALLDARPVCGNSELFVKLDNGIHKLCTSARANEFTGWLQQQNTQRTYKAGDGAMLEPELKQGTGGLRDYHQMHWLARLFPGADGNTDLAALQVLDVEELNLLQREFDFLLQVRSGLHALAGRCHDRLNFDFQPRLARSFGFLDEHPGLAAERFMARVHRAMDHVKALNSALWNEYAGRTQKPVRRPTILANGLRDIPSGLEITVPNPSAMLDLFCRAAHSGRPISLTSRRLLLNKIETIANQLRNTPTLISALLDIARAPHGLKALEAMRELGVLAALLPEFGHAQDIVQFDGFHLYPVGRHTLETLNVLALASAPQQTTRPSVDGENTNAHRNLPGSEMLQELLARLDNPEIVFLAALFHDLGKADMSQSHEETGAWIARNVLLRHGLSEDEAEQAEFLVRNHLLLVKTAMRRDLTDQQTIIDVAGVVKTPQRLDALTALNIADSMATGPTAWTGWTASLLSELHSRARSYLENGPLSLPNEAQQIMTTRDCVRRLSNGVYPSDYVEATLAQMPARYTQICEAPTIVEHLGLVREFQLALDEDMVRRPHGHGGSGLARATLEHLDHGLTRISFVAKDQPGLFATFCGILSLHGLDICNARIFTWEDGTVLDVFTVLGVPENKRPQEFLARLTQGVKYAYMDKLDIRGRLDDKVRSPLYKKPKPSGLPPRVSVDNTTSETHTIIELRADNRLGLLYDIANTFSEHNVDIHAAKIATSGDQALDTFSVRNSDETKVQDPEHIAALERSLEAALAPRV